VKIGCAALCADCSCRTLADLDRLGGKYQAITIKLDKVGGLTEALAWRRKRSGGACGSWSVRDQHVVWIAPALLLAQQAEIIDLDDHCAWRSIVGRG